MNMDAINLLKELEFDGRQATPEEQEVLSRYVGWGGLSDAFDETKQNWSDEFSVYGISFDIPGFPSAVLSLVDIFTFS